MNVQKDCPAGTLVLSLVPSSAKVRAATIIAARAAGKPT